MTILISFIYVDQDQVRHVLDEEYKQIEIENRNIRNTTHVKREIRSHHSTHPALSTLPPLSIPGLPAARLVLKVEITVTFTIITIITINIFITVMNDINLCLSLSSFELLTLPQSRQSGNSCQFNHHELFLRTPRGWLSNYRWSTTSRWFSLPSQVR